MIKLSLLQSAEYRLAVSTMKHVTWYEGPMLIKLFDWDEDLPGGQPPCAKYCAVGRWWKSLDLLECWKGWTILAVLSEKNELVVIKKVSYPSTHTIVIFILYICNIYTSYLCITTFTYFYIKWSWTQV